jgi:hypothetical protein
LMMSSMCDLRPGTGVGLDRLRRRVEWVRRRGCYRLCARQG